MNWTWRGVSSAFAAALVVTLCCELCDGLAPTEHMQDDEPATQTQYEWVHGQRVYQYAQDFSFSILAFTVPIRTQRADFDVTLSSSSNDNKTVLVLLRRSSIPVLQLYNETLPAKFVLPADQQTHYVQSDRKRYTITLESPTPGRVYMAATVVSPIHDVIKALQWRDPLQGRYQMNVRAMYTLLPNVTSLDTDRVTAVSLPAGETVTMSFRVPPFTTSAELIVTDCQTSSADCPVVVTVSESLYPEDTSKVSVDCTGQKERCSLKVSSPRMDKESFVTFSFSGNASDTNRTTLNISFAMQGCQVESIRYSLQSVSEDRTSAKDLTPQLYRSSVGIHHYLSTDSDPACVNQGLLGRVGVSSGQNFAFSAFFALWNIDGEAVRNIHVIVPDFTTEVRAFRLQDLVDSGGILALQASLETDSWNGRLWVCAMPHRIAENNSVEDCPHGALLQLNSTSSTEDAVRDVVYLPFPVAGTWYLSMQSQCWGPSGPEPCAVVPMISLYVNMTQCAPNSCGQYGTCNLYMEATTVFAACECQAGYRGLACNDTTYALSKEEQLRAVYLLTFSNLAFIPAILLAIYRRYYTLAAIFFFNFFCSSFYHACDSSHVFQLCITDYDTLQFCDFFGSILSFWAVLLTMAKLPESVRSFCMISGAMVIATLEDEDRLAVLPTVGPIVVAAVILLFSWAREMRDRGKLYPSKRRYLFFLLPGAVLALSGILVKFLVTSNEDYQYGHSYWHLSVMLAPCFLMPPRRGGSKGKNGGGLSISAQDILRPGDRVRPVQASAPQPAAAAGDGELGEEDQAAMFDASMNSINSERQNLIL